jgi:hypothetical protein
MPGPACAMAAAAPAAASQLALRAARARPGVRSGEMVLHLPCVSRPAGPDWRRECRSPQGNQIASGATDELQAGTVRPWRQVPRDRVSGARDEGRGAAMRIAVTAACRPGRPAAGGRK